MNSIFHKFLAVHDIEYLILNRDLKIIHTSSGVQRFVDCTHELNIGDEVSVPLPELIGVEELLLDVIEGRQKSFALKSMGRFSNPECPVYFDLYAIEKPNEETGDKNLIVFLEDVTERMTLEQRLVQATNETHLLLSALTNSKAYLEKIITSMAEALIVTTRWGTIERVNRTTEELFEYSEAELLNQHLSKIIPNERSFLELIRPDSDKKKEENVSNVEVMCKTKTGKKIYVSFSCSAIQTDIEDIQDFVYIGRDITDRKRKQQRRLAQAATIRILSESTTLKEAAPKLLPGLCESLGWDVGEIWMIESRQSEGSVESDFYVRCVECWHKSAIAIPEFTALTKQTTFTLGEGLPGLAWATGSPYWIHDIVDDDRCQRREAAAKNGLHGSFACPIFGDRDEENRQPEPLKSNEVLGVITFFSREVQPPDEDLLQTMATIGSQIGQFMKRKQAEAALQESEERYRDLFENASDLIQCVGLDGRFLYVNRAWRETLGYSESEIEKLTVFDIIHPDCKKQCLAILRQVISGETLDEVQTELIAKNQIKISVEGSISCRFIDGKPVATRSMFRNITERLKAEEALRQQQEKTERLLLNILPEPIAERLKQDEGSIAEHFGAVTVLFADIVGFTQIASFLSPIELVNLLNQIFSAFDRLSERHGLEKIKTIGDAYMVVAGLPKQRDDHAFAIAQMALDMQRAISEFNAANHKSFSIRIGIHSGPVVAGVIGLKKFIYDLWGDTVNTASRMESHGVAGRIQVSEATYQFLREQYIFDKRGTIQVKGKGEMNTYFLIGKKTDGDRGSLPPEDKDGMQSVRDATQHVVEMINQKLRNL